MLRRLTLAAVLALSCSAAAFAQQAPGDWNGQFTIPPGVTRTVGVHIDQGAAGLSGTIFSPDNNTGPVAIADVAMTNGVLTFKTPATRSGFEGKWDETKKAWAGDYTTPNGKFPLTLASGKIAPAGPVPAIAGMDGRWEGKLQGIMPIVVRLKTDIDGTLAQMDSPSQNAVGMPIRTFTRNGQKVAFAIPGSAITYEGDLSADGQTLSGTFAQLGQQLPFELKRVSADTSPTIVKPRPQTPKKPYPYKEEQVTVHNAGANLNLPCTLTLPDKPGRHPAAIMLTGSGAQDRDETLLGHKPFLVLADHLTKAGFAILRCDDRDFVRPLKDPAQMGSLVSELMTDAKAELAFLRARPEIDANRVGVIGHSEGGVTGPRVAADDPKVAFVVMLAGLGAKGRDVLLKQRELLLRTTPGVTEDTIQAANTMFSAMFDEMIAAKDSAAVLAAAKKHLATLPATPDMALNQAVIDQIAAQFGSAYYVDLLRYDPAPVFAKIKAPILAINGSKDIQVEAKQNLGGLKTLTAKNKDVTLVELPGLNHLFQTATTGAITEYADIDETFAPAALNTVSEWLVKRMKP